MQPRYSGFLLLLALLVQFAAPGRASAQACVGDCGNHGAVGINDLILAVNIVLGLAPVDDCPSLGSGPIGIAELIASVSNALCECQPCPEPPTPRPTNTRTATETPTPSPTHTPLPSATPTTVTVQSRWHEDQIKLPSSTCPQRIVTEIRRGLASTTENYIVYERGADSVIEDANGAQLPARIDDDRVLTFDLETSESQGACTVTLTLHVRVNIEGNSAMASYTGGFRTMSCPNAVNCSLKVTSRWTRQFPNIQYPGPDWSAIPTPPLNRPCWSAYDYGCGGGGAGGVIIGWRVGTQMMLPEAVAPSD
jgi:hypothetical protein